MPLHRAVAGRRPGATPYESGVQPAPLTLLGGAGLSRRWPTRLLTGFHRARGRHRPPASAAWRCHAQQGRTDPGTRLLCTGGWQAIRFNFRGWAPAPDVRRGRGETRDLLAVLEQTANRASRWFWRIFVWRLRGLLRAAQVLMAHEAERPDMQHRLRHLLLAGTAANRFTIRPCRRSMPGCMPERSRCMVRSMMVPLADVLEWARPQQTLPVTVVPAAAIFSWTIAPAQTPGAAAPAGNVRLITQPSGAQPCGLPDRHDDCFFPMSCFPSSSFRSRVAGAACLLLTATASLPWPAVAQPAGAVAAPAPAPHPPAPEPVAVPPVQPGFPAPPPAGGAACSSTWAPTTRSLAARTWMPCDEPASLTKLMTAYIVFDALKAARSAWTKPLA